MEWGGWIVVEVNFMNFRSRPTPSTTVAGIALTTAASLFNFGCVLANVNAHNLELLSDQLSFSADGAQGYVALYIHLVTFTVGCFVSLFLLGLRRVPMVASSAFSLIFYGISMGVYNYEYLVTVQAFHGFFAALQVCACASWVGDAATPQ